MKVLKYKKKNQQKILQKVKAINTTHAFTMIEALVAIAVLLLSLVGPLTIASKGIVSAAFARDQIIAFHLAREAVELVRNKRDNNAINGADWTDGLSNCLSPGVCMKEATSAVDSDFDSCPGGVCPPLRLDTSTGFYGYDSDWKLTPFVREITYTQLNTDEISVSVSISWKTGVLSKNFTINENLFNWQ